MPNNVIQKVYNGGNEYLVGGGTTEGAEVVYLTQAEYDALPASKLTDGKIYKIKTSGVAPTPMPGSIDSLNRFITNQPLATYTADTTIAEEDIPEGASFFRGVPEISGILVSGGFINLGLLKSNVGKEVALCSAYRDRYIKYENSSYTIHITNMNDKIYLF